MNIATGAGLETTVKSLKFYQIHTHKMYIGCNYDNKTIEQIAASSLNIRVGAEYRLDVLRLRLGYANYANAQNSVNSSDGNGDVFTGGLGLRMSNYYLDFGVVHNRLTQVYTPYLMNETSLTPVADVTSTNTKMMFTVGFNF